MLFHIAPALKLLTTVLHPKSVQPMPLRVASWKDPGAIVGRVVPKCLATSSSNVGGCNPLRKKRIRMIIWSKQMKTTEQYIWWGHGTTIKGTFWLRPLNNHGRNCLHFLPPQTNCLEVSQYDIANQPIIFYILLYIYKVYHIRMIIVSYCFYRVSMDFADGFSI